MKAKLITPLVLIALLIVTLAGLSVTGDEIDGRTLINEGTITIDPDEGEELTGTGSPIRTAVPGDDLRFTLWVNNNATIEQTVVMEIDTPEGWSISITGSVQVPSGDTRSIFLDISVPKDLTMDPQGEYSIRVEGLANATSDRAFIIVVVKLDAQVDHELYITPSNTKEMEYKVHPGQRTFIDIMLRNQGDIVDDIDLRIAEHQTDWILRFKEDKDILFINLPPGETDSIYRTSILVEVPETSRIGDTRDISIISTSNTSVQFDSGKTKDMIDLHFKVVPPSTLSIHPIESLLEIETGEIAHVEFELVLSGAVASTIEPFVRVLSGSFEQGGWQNSIDIAGLPKMEVGESRKITVHITPPVGTSGPFDILVDSLSDNAQVLEGKMSLIVRSETKINFTDMSISDSKLGSDILVNFRVLNNGDSSQKIVLDLEDVPGSFISEVEPSSFTLGSGRSRGVNVILYPKNNDIPLEFIFKTNIKVPLDDKGEWLLVNEIQIPVTITELPNVMVNSIILPNEAIVEGEEVPIEVTISNPSAMAMENITLEIKEITEGFSNPMITSFKIDLDSGEEKMISFNWTARPSARKIRAQLITEGSEETDTGDNDLTEPIYVIRYKIVDGGGDPNESSGMVKTEHAVAAIAGGSILVTALALFSNTDLVRYPLFSGLYPLYSKLKPEHLLSNRLRKRIYVYVQNNPGEHFRGILVNLDLTNGTLAHHLYTLERENLIRSQRDGLYRRFYPAGYHIDEEKVSLTPIQKRIMELLDGEPGLSQKEISLKLELSNSTVNYNIKSLKEKGVVDITKEGKSTHIFPTMDKNS